MYINKKWIFKNMVNFYNGILFSNKKEQTTDACNNVDESQEHAKRNHTTKYILYDSTYSQL